MKQTEHLLEVRVDSLSQGESVLERPTSSGKEPEKPSKERGPDRGPEREHLDDYAQSPRIYTP